MRAWLLTVGEPLPTDQGSGRDWRTGLLAQQLIARGHDVVWWSSAFDHFRRFTREPADVPIAVSPRLTVWHLSGPAYRRNVSLARIRNHVAVARRFRTLAPAQPRPDVILSSLPTLELCGAAVDYGRANRVPVALDIRDLWPDVLFDLLPRVVQPLGRFAVPWMTRQLRHAATGATAVLGVTDQFVRWGLDAAGRPATPLDRAFPMGYTAQVPDEAALASAREFWRRQGIDADARAPIVCFFGTIGWMFDFDTVLAAASRLQRELPELRFVLCGNGNRFEDLRRRAAPLSNVLLPGHVGRPEIYALMRQSIAGLAPYRSFRNFDDNMPNKPIEYMSAGLPIVASSVRVLAQTIDQAGCGLHYAHGDAAGLADAIRMLIADPARRATMGERAARLYHDHFVAERVYADMAAYLETLAQEEPR